MTITVEIDMSELACRLGEALQQVPRPDIPAAEALALLDDETRDTLMRCACAVTDYLTECYTRAGADVAISPHEVRHDA